MKKETIIRVRGITTGYGNNIILDNLSFDVFKGEVFVILGGSGCGKSTLLKNLIGIVNPIKGEIFIGDDNICSSNEQTFKKTLRKFGVLYQSSALLGSMTVAENIALPIREYTRLPESCIDRMVTMKLRLVNLIGVENMLPSELSGGMKKRAGLARAMALNPEILFFDEPSAGLDPISASELDELILYLNKTLKTTMVIVTHELESIFAISDRVIMLDKSTKGIIAEGNPRELKEKSTDPYVRMFFNPRTKREEKSYAFAV